MASPDKAFLRFCLITQIASLIVFFSAAETASSDTELPFYLQLSGAQCEDWTDAAEPRRQFLSNWTGRPLYDSQNPYRLDDRAVLIVEGERYELPLGHQPGKIPTSFYGEAVRGAGVETDGLYSLIFWMPSLRYPERRDCPYQRCCEPGRSIPSVDQYRVGVDVFPAATSRGEEARDERFELLRITELHLVASLDQVASGRASKHLDRIVPHLQGVIMFDGFYSWRSPDRDPELDWKRVSSFRLKSDRLFGVASCHTTAEPNYDETISPFLESCDIETIGPINPQSDLPEMRFSVPRRDLGDWEKIYWNTLTLLNEWKVEDDGSDR